MERRPSPRREAVSEVTRALLFRPEAESDVEDAFGWYEKQSPGLGSHFLLCMEATLSQINRYPEAFPVVHRHVHRALIRRFPYAVFYLLEDTRIVVIAVFHAKRSPRRLKLRK